MLKKKIINQTKTSPQQWCQKLSVVVGVHQSLKSYLTINLISIATSKGRSHEDWVI